MISSKRHNKVIELVHFEDDLTTGLDFASKRIAGHNSVDLNVDALEALARLKNLSCLLEEAPLILPEFPRSLNLVAWAAYNINEAEFADEISEFLSVNGYSSKVTIQSGDSEQLRNCKGLATAVQIRANELAVSILDLPQQSVFISTIEDAAKLHMLSFLRDILMRSLPIYQEKVGIVSIMTALRTSINKRSESMATWDLVYDKVVANCSETEIL
jgi:hypothetical protein